MKFFRRKLRNGITVIMEERDLPLVAISITNKFGASFEESKIKGIAHLIEHMVFTGTKTRTHEDISREIEKKGGMLNAFTSQEVTSFLFKLPNEHVFAGLDILCDIITNPKFDSVKFEKEKKVVLEEIKMYHDSPERAVFEKIEENLFAKPFGEGITGSEKSISALNRDFVYDYFKAHYSCENFIVTVVGDTDFNEICKYFEKNFSYRKVLLVNKEIKKTNNKSFEERPGIDQAHFVFAVHSPLVGSKEHFALEVLDAYLANGMSSRLFLKIREEKGLAYNVRSAINAEKNYSYYSIYAGTTKEALKEVEEIILDEFAKIDEMSDNDLEEAKERVIGLRKISSEESLHVMNELLFSELCGKAENYYNKEAEIRKVKLNDVKRLARKLIQRYSTAAIVPK